jgi:dTDP-glucose 4,6-dehydratase
LKLTKDLEHILHHCSTLWEQLRGKTIFVTGGTGFFGKWILESFIYANETLDLKAQMIVLSRDPGSFLSFYPQFNKGYIGFVKGDILNFAYPAGPVDYIIHAATDMGGYQNIAQATTVYDSIVEGTRHVLELARTKNVASILHTSSGAVYGKQPHDLPLIDEEYMGAPDVYDNGAAYGEGKRAAEMLANIYYHQYGTPSKIARCFAFVGPYFPTDSNFAVGNFIHDTINGHKIVIKGDGTPYRSYMYAADLTIWLWHILLNGQPVRPYNVGSDEAVSIAGIAQIVASFSPNQQKDITILTPPSGKPAARYVPDVKRAKEELNLNIYKDIYEAIKRTIDFYT